MTVSSVIEYINKIKGYNIKTEYYERIKAWRDWWEGLHKPFHEFTEVNGKKSVKRQMYTLKMGKKACEDWAAILLNEQTEIVVEHQASHDFLVGADGTGGVLGEADFWLQGNALIEKAFAFGTGAFVVKLNGMVSTEDGHILKSPNAYIDLDYIPAMMIVPLSLKNRMITEVAFVSEVTEKGNPYIYLEMHELDEQGHYVITNKYFSKDKSGKLREQELPEGIAETISTGSDIPLFAIVSPNIVNTFDGNNGLGMSVFAHAIDNLKGIDLAFNNLCKDFKLGGKKVFYRGDMIQRDENGRAITPDDVMQQLFVRFDDNILSENGQQNAIVEFNPLLRVKENTDAVQSQLDYFSFKCGFGTKHYQFNASQIITATQYTGDKQELIQNASKHYIAVENAIKTIAKAILWAGKEIIGVGVDPDANITVNFEDSFIIDSESERQRDIQEMREGIMQKWEYRVKWYGENEEMAKKMVGETVTDDELLRFGGA